MATKLLNETEIRSLILKLSGYSENQYTDMILHGADEYLQRTLRQEDDYARIAMRKSAFFWKWWVNQWNRRNRILLHQLGYSKSTVLCREERYNFRLELEQAHSIDRLNVYPNRIVMENTYAIMIGELHDEMHRKGASHD